MTTKIPARMLAISVRQPWAWLIVNGYKDIENRKRRTNHRGPILIHASLKVEPIADEWPWPDIPRPETFEVGGVIGQADIIDCVSASSSRWFQGPIGYLLANARPLPFLAWRGNVANFHVDLPEHFLPRR